MDGGPLRAPRYGIPSYIGIPKRGSNYVDIPNCNDHPPESTELHNQKRRMAR